MKKINEIFYSLQGEGAHSGEAATFVRFSGCNLKCPFCDTDHLPYREMSDEEIVAEVAKNPSRLVVITGGEPSLWIDAELVEAGVQPDLILFSVGIENAEDIIADLEQALSHV